MLSEIFWSFFMTSIIGCMLSITRMCYKSKCSTCEFCGIKIIRDVALEEKEQEFIINHNAINNNESKENI